MNKPKTKYNVPNKKTMAALREYPKMQNNKRKYKRYKSSIEALK